MLQRDQQIGAGRGKANKCKKREEKWTEAQTLQEIKS